MHRYGRWRPIPLAWSFTHQIIFFMDFIFHLGPEDRGRFLRSAGRVLGCSYICLWSPLYHPSSNYFTSMDGWHHEDDGFRTSLSPGSNSKRLFDSYRRSLCGIQGGTVPGLAYKSNPPFLELEESDLMNLACLQEQRRFYQESGIKTAVFLACANGEIEFGTTNSSNANLRLIAHQVFSEDFIQQYVVQGEELHQQYPVPAADHSRPSSSSSSLRSLSVESPDQSSVLLAVASAAPETNFVLPHPIITKQAFSGYQNFPFPPSAIEEAAMTRAMLAVISSRSSSPREPALRSPAARSVGAFSSYNPAFAPRTDTIVSNLQGQKMIKKMIDQLRKVKMMPPVEAVAQDARATISHQLHHTLAERKRRVKLNESFDALKMLLPPGSKKDKASVLANTRSYLNTLKAQISELEERNQLLTKQLLNPDDRTEEEGGNDSNERVSVETIPRTSEPSTSEAQGTIWLIITVRADGNMTDLILRVLKCLKEMENSSLVAVEANTRFQTNASIRARFTLQVKIGDRNEETFKEAVIRAVDAAVADAA